MQLGPVLAGSVKEWTRLIFQKVISHQKPSWQPFKPSPLHAVLFFPCFDARQGFTNSPSILLCTLP